jgi:uncharacterized YigZ family protein
MKTSFRTISKPAEGIFKDKGSKFLAFAYPVSHEDAVKPLLEELRKKHHSARHHCYAWRMGVEEPRVRANDDGEPSGSAGRPILNQIEKADLTNILVVIVRYFGGTLLGVGGLINAYRTATENVLHCSHIVRKKMRHLYHIAFDYAQMNDVMTVMKEHQLEPFDQVFELSCTLRVEVDLDKEKLFADKMKLISGCTFNIIKDG